MILRIQSSGHNVHEVKMASEDGTRREVTEELTQIRHFKPTFEAAALIIREFKQIAATATGCKIV